MNAGLRAAARFRNLKILHGYAKGKVAWDPAYAALAGRLRVSTFPILDIGCGVGLLGAYLRECNCNQPILGIEPDENKVRLATQYVTPFYSALDFQIGDARELPEFEGDVVMLDVLHYLSASAQRKLLESIAQRLAPGGRAFIRTALRDGSWRYLATLAEEAFVRLSGWIRGGHCLFPTLDDIQKPFQEHRWSIHVSPMWGCTPFNSYLIEITRPR